MAKRLANFLSVTYEPPVSDTEKLVARWIGHVLGRDRVGQKDNFFALGGDSLRATQVISRLQQELEIELPTLLLFRSPTVGLLGARLDELFTAQEIERLAAELSGLSIEEQARLLDETRKSTV